MAVPRRTLLHAAAGGVLPLCESIADTPCQPEPSLREAAERAGLYFGSDSDVPIAAAPPEYAALFLKNCELLAPLVSWQRAVPDRFSEEPAWEDPNIGFARANGLRLTGAHLLWHENLPPWFDSLTSPGEAEEAVERHIVGTMRRYGRLVYSWNVVNEAIEPKHGRPDGMRNSPLLRRLGDDYIVNAFHAARAASRDCILVYNEYGLEMDRHDHEARRTALLKLLDRLQAARAPIDAVGLQSHLRLGRSRFDGQRFQRFLSEISSRNLAILITELDVFDGDSTSDVATRDNDVASMYAVYLETALADTAVSGVITWGLADRYTWLNMRTDLHRVRPGDRHSRPLLFDSLLRPKPAFHAVLSALNHASLRRKL